METHIYEVVDRMNTLRKQSNQMGYWVVLIFFAPLLLIMMVSSLIQNKTNGSMVMAVLYFAYIVILVAGIKNIDTMKKRKLEELKRLYKETFMNGVLEEFFENVDYRWETGISQQQFFNTGIFQQYREITYRSEDYLSGVYKGVPFKQADVKIKSTEKDKSNFFFGRLFEFDYSFKQVQSVRIVPKAEVVVSNRFEINRQNIVQMENMEFNKIFTVASVSAEEAFYALTPQVMERLMTIYNRYRRSEHNDGNRSGATGQYRAIAFHFKQDKLYVAIDHMDSFDSNFLKEVDYPTEKEKIRKHIQVIIDIIEMLKLINE